MTRTQRLCNGDPSSREVPRALTALVVALFIILPSAIALGEELGMPPAPQSKHRVYAHLMDSREHPDYDRKHVRPPSWDTFGNRTRFTSLRGFNERDGKLVNFAEELDKYTRVHELGDIIWPAYPVLFADNLNGLLAEIRRRDLFLFDIWGYVPGSGPGGYWQQFKPPPGVFNQIESALGDRWLGMDNGEQDGRYIGGYANQMHPVSASRLEQYFNFQNHFERMCNELGNRMCTLVSLNFGHYFLKEGVYTLIGAETGQALPNGQVYYAFIRGAGKQYGVPWFGNASVFNRWGYKSYGPEGADHSPTKGTSLSLMKRLMYCHILYNCMLAGFESGFFDADGELSPIGRIQQSTRRWTGQFGQPGPMIVPIAVMTDFFAGWSFPRHLYTDKVYRVWGNLPYGAGDYLTEGVLDMLYPGFQNSSYYHDESGFISPTPYGDAADCLLSDAPAWLLRRYSILVVAGELSGGAEIRDKLSEYAANGGRLFLTAGSLAKLPGGLAGLGVSGSERKFEAVTQVQLGTTALTESSPFTLLALTLPDTAEVLGRCGGLPAVVRVSCGNGSITVFASPFGVPVELIASAPIRSEIDKALPRPYPLLQHVRVVLDEAFKSQRLFSAGENLSLITCRQAAGKYTLAVCNNTWRQQPLKIVSHCGPIESIQESPLDQSAKSAVGHVPEGLERLNLGTSDENNIAGGDVRIFSVQVREERVEEIPHVSPPPRPVNRLLPLRNVRSIKEEVLARPTFFEHFDGVVIDWTYLWDRERHALKREAGWIERQGLRVFVDLTSGLNLYPVLRLLDNITTDYENSLAAIEDVYAKMAILGARHLILSLHRSPETNFTPEQTSASFEATLRKLCLCATEHEITLYLRTGTFKPPFSIKEAVRLLESVGSPNLRLAVGTESFLAGKVRVADIAGLLKDHLGLWLAATSASDMAGRVWNLHAPLAECEHPDTLAEFIAIAPDAPVALDALYADHDEEYQDARILDRVGTTRSRARSQTAP